MLNLLTYCNLNVKFFLLDGARHGISRDDATREMCNVWKSDSRIAAIVLNEKIGKFDFKVPYMEKKSLPRYGTETSHKEACSTSRRPASMILKCDPICTMLE